MSDELKHRRMVKAQELLAQTLESNVNDLRDPKRVDVDEWEDEQDMLEATLNNIKHDYGVNLVGNAFYFWGKERKAK